MSLTNRILISMVAGILIGSLLNLLLHSSGLSDAFRVVVDDYLINGLLDFCWPNFCSFPEVIGCSFGVGFVDLRLQFSWR